MPDWLDDYLKNCFEKVREKRPLVHHITNYVTVNDCANVTLACGAAPVMADDIGEVREIVNIASALVINIGTLNQRTIESMLAAGEAANQKGIPVILDPVGAGATSLRTRTALRLIEEFKPTVIRGNISEIKAISGHGGKTRGVDADAGDSIDAGSLEPMKKLALEIAAKTGSIIAITGQTDLITDGKRIALIKNGHPLMAQVTGTGCMCTSLIGSFCGASEDFLAATAAAVMVMGLAGELAFESVENHGLGCGSYRTLIIDAISSMTSAQLRKDGRIDFAG
ncbi:MAG TPA: hydroxyethylthiazole kinase [Bacillota bacterium]|nr:hydroxyethylthiazole kinase [Bacillota bacterium]